MGQTRSDQNAEKSWLDKISQALTGEPKNRKDLIEILREASERDLLDSHTLDMIEGILTVPDIKTKDIMVPRPQIIFIGATQSLTEILPIVLNSGHSRFPVISDNPDEILGILLAKDLLRYAFHKEQKFDIHSVLRPARFIPETKRLDTLLQAFRENKNHMAVVVDEYGGVTGLITIEDVIEQIVGDIEDEHDIDGQDMIKARNDGTFSVRATTPIADFNEHFTTDYDEKEIETIGGLVVRRFGHLPKRGDTVQIKSLSFKVIHADARRIQLLQVIPAGK